MISAEETAKVFAKRCFAKGSPRVINPHFNQTYVINNEPYKFTQEVLEQILMNKKLKVTHVGEKEVMIMGIVK